MIEITRAIMGPNMEEEKASSSLLKRVMALEDLSKSSYLVAGNAAPDVMSIIDRYRYILQEGVEASSAESMLKGVNGITGVNKGLVDDPDTSKDWNVMVASVEVLELAIRLGKKLRMSGTELNK